jgi:hypothetical protein
MARRRHETNSSKRARELQREEQHLSDLRFLSKRGKRPDPDNYKAVRRVAQELRQREALEKNYSHRASKEQRDVLKARGFHTTKRGVVIDGPRDSRRKKIAGAKMSIQKGGIVKWSVGQRRDFVYGFTKAEKKAYAKNPELFTKNILARLRKANPTLKAVRPSRIQTRLQWGAFQGTKDFAPSYFTKKYFESVSPEDESKGRKSKRLDKLTGLHFVVHVPAERKPKRGGNAKRSKKK